MKNLKSMLLAIMLVVVLVSPALAVGPASQDFPLEKGTEWVFAGPVQWTKAGSDDVQESTMTWTMKITDTIERQQVFAAVVKGHPLDLAFYDEDTVPGDYLIVRVGTGLYYLLSGDRVKDVLPRLQDQDDVLTDLVQDAECFLDLPLESGKNFGETFQVTRQDGMYFWNVTGEGAAELQDIKSATADTGATQYELAFNTTSDDQQVGFVPGLGFTHYAYNHHGTTSRMDLKLTEFHTEGVKLTKDDAGKSVEVPQGASLQITLAANPTTGYTWQVAAGDEGILKLVGEPAYQAESDLMGAPGMMTLTFTAAAAGTTDLKLVYARPWESVQPAETFEVHVTVK